MIAQQLFPFGTFYKELPFMFHNHSHPTDCDADLRNVKCISVEKNLLAINFSSNFYI